MEINTMRLKHDPKISKFFVGETTSTPSNPPILPPRILISG